MIFEANKEFMKNLSLHDDIKQLKRKRRRLEKKTLNTDLPGDWNNYHKVRNQYSALLKSAGVNILFKPN